MADDRYGGEATASIRVQIWDTAPQAPGLSISTDEDTSLEMTLRGSDPDDDPLQYIIISGPTHGSLSGTAPNMTYTPDPNYYGADSFTYKVSDTVLESAVATVTITVNPVNDLPVLESIPDKDVNEGGGLSFILSATDIDGDPLSYSMISGPGSMVGFTYEYSADWDTDHVNETYSVTIQVSDSYGGTDTRSFAITVHDVNRPPTATPESVVAAEDTPVGITLIESDPDGDPLTFSIVSEPTNGSLSGTPPNVTYTPNPDYNGSDSFTFQVADGYGGTATATVSITVNPVNDPPVAVDDYAITEEDVSVMIAVLANDSDPDRDILTITSVSMPWHGTATIIGDGVRYDPDPGYSGMDSFTYTISDGHGGTAGAT
ncbi:MAG: Ig-like domain-containing protein, partial [Candidatus Bipolaricaulia bacterium]